MAKVSGLILWPLQSAGSYSSRRDPGHSRFVHKGHFLRMQTSLLVQRQMSRASETVVEIQQLCLYSNAGAFSPNWNLVFGGRGPRLEEKPFNAWTYHSSPKTLNALASAWGRRGQGCPDPSRSHTLSPVNISESITRSKDRLACSLILHLKGLVWYISLQSSSQSDLNETQHGRSDPSIFLSLSSG
jgi:hypothetical protein